MLNYKSINTVNDSRFEGNFVKPCYGSYCFSGIPSIILNIFADRNFLSNNILPLDCLPEFKNIDNVVLFLIDGYGWKFFEEDKNKFLSLKRFEQKGIVSKLTAQFPSTTVSEITTINTALNVGEHGFYEWNIYDSVADDIIAPFLYKRTKDDINESLNIDPNKIFPSVNIYNRLKKKNVNSTVLSFKDYMNSSYNKTICQGANILSYSSVSEGFSILAKELTKAKNKNYFYFYLGDIDHAMHEFGIDSNEKREKTNTIFNNLEEFFKKIDGKIKDTLFLLVADHGHYKTDERNVLFINLEFPEILQWLKTNNNGELLRFAGSPRDLFLYIKDEFLDIAFNFLSNKLDNKALVFKTEYLIKNGFFGKEVSKNLKERIGNLVILSFNGNSFWWKEDDLFKNHFKSHHGSLTRDEMEIPFLALKI